MTRRSGAIRGKPEFFNFNFTHGKAKVKSILLIYMSRKRPLLQGFPGGAAFRGRSKKRSVSRTFPGKRLRFFGICDWSGRQSGAAEPHVSRSCRRCSSIQTTWFRPRFFASYSMVSAMFRYTE